MKMLRDSGRQLRRTWREHERRWTICGCPDCDGVTVPLGKSRSTEKREWQREVERS